MQQWVQKYSGILRNLKPTYWLYNLSNLKKLKSNKSFYKKFGIQKQVWQSIGHADIKNISSDIPWMDKPTITQEQIKNHPNFSTFSQDIQDQFLQWNNNGYMILKGFFLDKVDAINTEIEKLQTQNKVDYNFTGRKIMDAWKHSSILNEVFRNGELLKIFEFIFQKKAIPFQTINFLFGSEQKPHSDFLHMTTEPLGYLSAMWIALEDIQPGSGELVYYPGSNKLPYIFSEHYNTGNTGLTIGKNNYNHYEEKIEQLIKENNLQPQYFYAKKGDVLIWHANLLHGGSVINNKNLTRKSMVGHYYADGVLCYHDISQRPAVINT